MQNTTQQQNKTAVVLLSGGQDSTTCLFWALENFDKVIALGFDYGQKQKKELECAKEICVGLKIDFYTFSLPLLNELTTNALTRPNIAPDAVGQNVDAPNTLVEGRNMIFLTYAAVFAKARGIFDLVTGVSQADNSGYPDCRESFIKSLEITLELSMAKSFNIHTPLIHLTKAQIWKLADDLDALDIVRFKTMTCYNGKISDGCGACKACSLRSEGFKEFFKNATKTNGAIKYEYTGN